MAESCSNSGCAWCNHEVAEGGVVQLSEEYTHRHENPAHNTSLEAVRVTLIEAACSRCREKKQMLKWCELGPARVHMDFAVSKELHRECTPPPLHTHAKAPHRMNAVFRQSHRPRKTHIRLVGARSNAFFEVRESGTPSRQIDTGEHSFCRSIDSFRD